MYCTLKLDLHPAGFNHTSTFVTHGERRKFIIFTNLTFKEYLSHSIDEQSVRSQTEMLKMVL